MKLFKKQKQKVFKIVFHRSGMFHYHTSKFSYGSNYWSSVYKGEEGKLTCQCGIELPSMFSLGYSDSFYRMWFKEDEKAIGTLDYMANKHIEGAVVDWVNEDFWNKLKDE